MQGGASLACPLPSTADPTEADYSDLGLGQHWRSIFPARAEAGYGYAYPVRKVASQGGASKIGSRNFSLIPPANGWDSIDNLAVQAKAGARHAWRGGGLPEGDEP